MKSNTLHYTQTCIHAADWAMSSIFPEAVLKVNPRSFLCAFKPAAVVTKPHATLLPCRSESCCALQQPRNLTHIPRYEILCLVVNKVNQKQC